MSYTKSDIAVILEAAALIAGSAVPAAGTVMQLVAFALAQSQVALRENRMTQAEVDELLAKAKADRKLVDAFWDAQVAQARGQA